MLDLLMLAALLLATAGMAAFVHACAVLTRPREGREPDRS